MAVGQLAGFGTDSTRQHDAQLVIEAVVIALAPRPFELHDIVLGQHGKGIQQGQEDAAGGEADEPVGGPGPATPEGSVDREDEESRGNKAQQIKPRANNIDREQDGRENRQQAEEPEGPLHRSSLPR